MRVGVICEGSTDFAVIEALAIALAAADECVLLQPDFDRLRAGESSAGTGWQAVRKFLRRSGPALGLGVFDVLVIQVDASVRLLGEVAGAGLRPPGEDEPDLAPLCEHVRSWAGGRLPEGAVIALPREELESWLLWAQTNLKHVEAHADPAEELAARGLLARTKKGAPDKDAARYRELSATLTRRAKQAQERRHVAELDRFVGKLLALSRAPRSRKPKA
jgi:hypothetical protein